MDRQLDIDNFERLLQERSEEFKMYPTKRVWHSIYNNIHPGKKWPSIATCIVLISILLLVGFLNTNDTASKVSTTKSIYTLNSNATTIQNNNLTNVSLLLSENNNNNPSNSYPPNNLYTLNNLNKSGTAFSKLFYNATFENILTAVSEKKAADISSNNDCLKETSLSKLFIKAKKGIITASKTKTRPVIIVATPAIATANLNSSSNPLAAIKNAEKPTNIYFSKEINNSVTYPIDDPNQLTETGSTEGLLKIDNSNVAHLSNGSTAQTTVIKKRNIKKVSGITTNLSSVSIEYKPLILSETDKAWIENFALYNRPVPKKWAGKLAWQLYITPSVVYRTLKNYKPDETDINKEVTQHPSMGLEIGAGIIYPIIKGVKIKTGLQLNYTRYNTEAYENSHPVSSSISLHDTYGQYYENSRTTPFSNYGGITPTNLHNDTYQISIPMGTEIKLAGNDNLQWNIGATIQPTYVFGGRSYLISADKRNFIKETTFINRFNLNAGFETFVSYKVDGFTFQFGPQFRKQIFTTNSKVYNVQEKLNNYGIRFGVTKIIK